MMKHLFTFPGMLKDICLSAFLCAAMHGNAQTTLQAGDLIFVGYNAELNVDPGNDQFAFILLRDIAAGTVIYFTDYGWTSSGGFQGNPNNGCPSGEGSLSDGIVKWTSATAMSAGAQVVVNCRINISANVGTAVGFQPMYNIASNYMSLATGGDQIFAYQGSFAAPTLIAGLGMSGAWESSLTTCQLTATSSVVPAALGTAYCWNLLPEVDNAAYNPSFGTVGSPAALRALIMDPAHWITDDNANITLPVAGTFTALGVSLGSFDVKKENNGAGLYWTTQSETNNAAFNIQRSMDGERYQTIGTVASRAEHGNSRSVLSYSYSDPSPVNGMNFYRLAEKDRDGNIVYSGVRTLNYDGKPGFNCYPNPVRSQLVVEHESETDEMLIISIADATGKTVRIQAKQVQKGFNKTNVDMDGLCKGIYNMTIISNSGAVYTSRVTKD